MIKNILFDLDGTLINTLQEKFNKKYFESVYKKLLDNRYDASFLSKIIVDGIKTMVFNNGKLTNEEAFWKHFEDNSNMKRDEVKNVFDSFYLNEYDELKVCVETVKKMNENIRLLKNKGYNLILSTNPLFPKIAIEKRASWGGIDCSNFSYITSYENSSYAKPNINYYKEIINKNNLNIEETMMFGNDLIEDLIIEELKIPCFIITNNMVNLDNIQKCTKKGDYNEFFSFINNLPNIN